MSSDRPDKTMKQQVKQKIERARLSDAQLDDLLGMQEDLLQQADNSSAERVWRKPYLLAAVASLCLFVVAMLTWPHPQQDDKLAAIAKEVAKNHLKQRPMELDTQSMAAVQSFFTELEFSPVSSAYLQDRLAGVIRSCLAHVTAQSRGYGCAVALSG